MIKFGIAGGLAVGLIVLGAASAQAQRPLVGGMGGPTTTFKPGGYVQTGSIGGHGIHHNPVTGSTYIPNVGVAKPTGIYTPIGNGYYQNGATGNVYNPTTGSYTQGANVQFKPGGYVQTGHTGTTSVHHNPATGSTYYKGQAVVKPTGVYTPIGNGYYQNPVTGNVYNPTTGIYKGR